MRDDPGWAPYLAAAREEVEEELRKQTEAAFAVAVERGLNISREDVRALLLALRMAKDLRRDELAEFIEACGIPLPPELLAELLAVAPPPAWDWEKSPWGAESVDKPVAEAIIRKLDQKGWSRGKLARELNVSAGHMSSVLNGKHVSHWLLERAAYALGINVPDWGERMEAARIASTAARARAIAENSDPDQAVQAYYDNLRF